MNTGSLRRWCVTLVVSTGQHIVDTTYAETRDLIMQSEIMCYNRRRERFDGMVVRPPPRVREIQGLLPGRVIPVA